MAYQKEGVLKDGTRVKLRPMVKETAICCCNSSRVSTPKH